MHLHLTGYFLLYCLEQTIPLHNDFLHLQIGRALDYCNFLVVHVECDPCHQSQKAFNEEEVTADEHLPLDVKLD